MSTASYLNQILDPMTDLLTPDVARSIVGLRVSPELEGRVAYLRERANEGTLTPDEDAEYKDFVEAVDVLSIIQSKARRFLARQPS